MCVLLVTQRNYKPHTAYFRQYNISDNEAILTLFPSRIDKTVENTLAVDIHAGGVATVLATLLVWTTLTLSALRLVGVFERKSASDKFVILDWLKVLYISTAVIVNLALWIGYFMYFDLFMDSNNNWKK